MSTPVRKFHLVQEASAGGLGVPSPEQETIVALSAPPKARIGVTVEEVAADTQTYDWRPVPVVIEPEPVAAAGA